MIDRFGSDVMLIREDDEHFSVNVEAVVSPQFYAWVFGFGAEAEILSPQSAREGMAAIAAQVLRRNIGRSEAMAQRTIHYLIGEALIAREGVTDVDRFRVGNLLPDAIAGLAWRDQTHFQRIAPAERRQKRAVPTLSSSAVILPRSSGG